MKINKKAEYSLKDIPWIAIVLTVGVISLAIATQITSDIKTDYSRPTRVAVNESDGTTLIWLNGSNMTLDHSSIASIIITNCSSLPGAPAGATPISSGNYTLFAESNKIQCDQNGSGGPHDTDPVCVNYTYYVNDYVYNTTAKGGQGQLNFSNWFPIIGVVLGAVLIISVLLLLGYARPR